MAGGRPDRNGAGYRFAFRAPHSHMSAMATNWAYAHRETRASQTEEVGLGCL